MPLQKQPININFAQDIDTKSDPNQIPVGKFAVLNNAIRDVTGALTKRNGYGLLTSLPNTQQTTLTTLNNNLIATGSSLYAYNAPNNQWINRGILQNVNLSVVEAVRTSNAQSGQDLAVASNGIACICYADSSGGSYYQILNSTTGEELSKRILINSTATNVRVNILGSYFIVSFLYSNAGTPNLGYLYIPIGNFGAVSTSIQQVSAQVATTNVAYDVCVNSNILYFAFTASDGSTKLYFLTSADPSHGNLSTATTLPSLQPSLISLSGDPVNGFIWLTYVLSSGLIQSMAYQPMLSGVILAATTLTTTSNPLNALSSLANNGVNTIFYETVNTYASPYPVSGVQSDYTSAGSISVSGTVVTPTVILRSAGLASKPFMDGTTIYMLVAYGQKASPTNSNQPSYFLIDSLGNIYMRLAYSNGGGYVSTQVLSNVTLVGNSHYVAYQYADFLASINTTTNNTTGTPVNAIYTQTGLNIAAMQINDSQQYSSEIAGTLNLTGGQLWMYDGSSVVEQGFQVWPENLQAVYSTTGGNIVAQPSGYVAGQAPYYYQAVYEWTDATGNIHRSSPSIPLPVTTSGTGTTGSITVYIPYLRLTYKTGTNPVRICLYRWSVAQQVYYEVTSVTSPLINSTTSTTDYAVFTDTFADSAILGNTLIYTNGGVIEDIAAPASIASTLFGSRLWLIDAEDRNLLWYSKQVIESTPVEMSDLLTIYVAPTLGSQGSTGECMALSTMDDKLIIFKANAAYYINGTGPDNTGANSQYSDPVFITASVGCSNPNSIVLTPTGLMFQSDKGIWLLGRDLSTQYIGAPVEAYNSETVKSANAIPGTNQIRFILESNTTLVYDYYYQQWSTFSNIQAISATLYQNQHIYLNALGQVLQETPKVYLDVSSPVLMNYTTGWINVAGLRGFERFYYFLLLGSYSSPCKLNVGIAYDYNPSPSQNVLVTPDNQTPNWGGDANWGSNQGWGGIGSVFEARVFPMQQKCQSFQISVNEVYDSSYSVPAGKGITLSGMTMVIGAKKGYSPQKASRSFG